MRALKPIRIPHVAIDSGLADKRPPAKLLTSIDGLQSARVIDAHEVFT